MSLNNEPKNMEIDILSVAINKINYHMEKEYRKYHDIFLSNNKREQAHKNFLECEKIISTMKKDLSEKDKREIIKNISNLQRETAKINFNEKHGTRYANFKQQGEDRNRKYRINLKLKLIKEQNKER